MSRWLLWIAMLVLIPGPTAGMPRYFMAIHCDPHNNREVDWISLKALVAAADALDFKLTIQLSTGWESLLAATSGSGTDLATWASWGHEIGGHHHTLEHSASWDGYSNDPLALVSMRPPGYLGDMQAWIDALQAQLPAGIEVRTVASWDEDFPPGVPFQTGGSSSSVAPADAISQPTSMAVASGDVWNLSTAAMFPGGSSQLSALQAVFNAAGEDDVFGVAFHPSDYYPGSREVIDDWLDFLAIADPGGTRSHTAGEILEPYVDAPVLPATAPLILLVGVVALLGAAARSPKFD